MNIVTPRLLLIPVEAQHLGRLFDIYSDPATNAFNPAGPYPDIDHAKRVLDGWLQHEAQWGFGHWAIAEKSDPQQVIGFCCLNAVSIGQRPSHNLGYRFCQAAWGRGLATEVARALIAHGFDTLGLTDISAIVRPNHLASQQVLLKAGLHQVGQVDDVPGHPASLLFSITQECAQ